MNDPYNSFFGHFPVTSPSTECVICLSASVIYVGRCVVHVSIKECVQMFVGFVDKYKFVPIIFPTTLLCVDPIIV